MSYILDTLKKLEKEKSEFKQKLNLRELIVKEDNTDFNTIKLLRRRNYFLTSLAVATTLFFFLISSDFNYFKKPFTSPAENLAGGKTIKQALIEKPEKFKSTTGIQSELTLNNTGKLPPLTSLSYSQNQAETENDLETNQKTIQSSLNEEAIEESTPGALETNQKIIQPSLNEEAIEESIPVALDISDENLDHRLDHLEQLIQEKYIPELLDHQTQQAIKEKEDPVPPQAIYDLAISGIVFFGEGNSLNYVLASYKGNTQIKLKEGDQFDDFEILKIKSEKILLLSQGKVFEKSLRN